MAVYKVTVDEATTVLGVTEAVTILSEQVTGVQGPSGTNGTNGTNGATGATPVISATSTTNLTIGTGSKSWTIASGVAFTVGQYVRVTDDANALRFMAGPITAYSGTTLTVNVQETAGSGSLGAAVTIAITGTKGTTGSTGSTGATGATGSSGVVDVDDGELTNTGTSTAAQLGLATAGTAGTYTKVTTDTFGRVTTGTTLVAGDIPTIAATQVTGTAYTKTNKVSDDYRLASTYDIIPRLAVSSTRTLTNGTVFGTVFTPQENFTLSNFQMYATTGGTDVGGTTVRRMGLFTMSGDTATLVARTDSDATLFTANNTIYTRALSTTGGFPSSYSLVSGTTYMVGVIAYNTGGTFNIPTISAGANTTQTFTPRICLGLTSQTDLPTAATLFATNTNAIVFARLT